MTDRPSVWEKYSAPANGDALFGIPSALDRMEASPEPSIDEIADAIAASWRCGAARDALRPVVVRLLEVGRRHSTAGIEDAEEVSSAVYVMF